MTLTLTTEAKRVAKVSGTFEPVTELAINLSSCFLKSTAMTKANPIGGSNVAKPLMTPMKGTTILTVSRSAIPILTTNPYVVGSKPESVEMGMASLSRKTCDTKRP